MNAEREDIYSRITNQIVSAIEAGTAEFRLPWHISEADCFSPVNAVSKRPYRGINVVILWAAAMARGFEGGFWATYNQWKGLGAQVKKGEQGTTVVLWKPTERPAGESDDESGETIRRGLLARGFTVFNSAQVNGFTPKEFTRLSEGERIREVELVLFGVGADIVHGGGQAFYDITADRLHLPRFDSFRNILSYYSTLAHELAHWTGARSRLNRDLTSRFRSEAYAMEELVAELGAAFLCARFRLAVEPRPDHANYIASWLSVLNNDKRALFTAASKAQQATDWLLKRSGAASHTPIEQAA